MITGRLFCPGQELEDSIMYDKAQQSAKGIVTRQEQTHYTKRTKHKRDSHDVRTDNWMIQGASARSFVCPYQIPMHQRAHGP